MSYDPVSPAAVASRKVARNYVNGSGSTLPMGAPISTLSSGLVTTVNVSSQASVDAFVGLYNQSTPSAASGLTIDAGLLENITGYSFSVGDPIYVSKTGTLSNVIPSVGVGGFVSGDFVIFLGVIVQNEFNGLQQDLKILIVKPGSL